VAIHFGCGLLSLLSVVICDGDFITKIIRQIQDYERLTSRLDIKPFIYYGWYWQLLFQLIGICVIILWCTILTVLLFKCIPVNKRNIDYNEQATSNFFSKWIAIQD